MNPLSGDVVRYRLVILDFDGTLADSFTWFVGIFNDAADRYRFKRIEASELEALRGLSGRQLMKHAGVSPWRLPFIANYVRSQRARYTDQVTLFPGVSEMLRRLSDAGMLLAIVSSNSEENVRHVLGPTNERLIGQYECGTSLFGKAASFRRVLRRSGIPADQVLCIGDEIRDLEAARSSGLAFGAVSWGYTIPGALRAHGPREHFDRVEQIVERVAGHVTRQCEPDGAGPGVR